MNVFILGATGYIGTALTRALREQGCNITALARTEGAASKLQARGDTPVRGELTDLAALRESARAADGVVDLAITKAAAPQADVAERAIDAIDGLAGSGKPFVYTTGPVYGVADGTVVTEDHPMTPAPMFAALPALERRVLANGRQVRGIVIRPTLVYGGGGGAGVLSQLDAVRRLGFAPYLGAGDQLISTVHVDDLAELYNLALQRGPAGTAFNGTGETVARKPLAEALAHAAGAEGATAPISLDQARATLRPMELMMLLLNAEISGQRARTALGWRPRAVSLLDDLRRGSYR